MTVNDIQKAILELTLTQFAQQIERDAYARKLDCLAERAIADLRKGYAREL